MYSIFSFFSFDWTDWLRVASFSELLLLAHPVHTRPVTVLSERYRATIHSITAVLHRRVDSTPVHKNLSAFSVLNLSLNLNLSTAHVLVH